MLNDLWIVIAVGEREKYLQTLIKNLDKYKNNIIFINNHLNYTKFDLIHHIEDFNGINIYRWWNLGIKYAESMGAKYVAILNDDLEFDENFIDSLFNHLKQNDFAIVDMENSGNNGGSAWIMNLSYNFRLDERFRWWYGDTFIFDQAKKINKFSKFAYNNFKHLEPNWNLINSNGYLQQLIDEDCRIYHEMVK